MSRSRSPIRDHDDHADEYELPSLSPTEPLLPRYSESSSPPPKPKSASSDVPRANTHTVRFAAAPAGSSRASQHIETLRKRRQSRIGRVLLCTWAAIVPLFLTLALLGCWVGRSTLNELRHWDAWDSVPQDVKEWLQSVVPGAQTQDLGNFPTNIGYPGPTPTGKEPALLATAPHLPMVTPLSPLVPPKSSKHSFHIPNYWGNLSPYHSVESHGLDDASALIPEGCELEELHWLQRHGARYPTATPGGPADLGQRLKEATNWKAKGDLAFLNDWSYKLGAEVLTPFGRSQLYNLGVAARVKYGYLLDRMKGRLPVWRTESQDRMLKSAQNFAAGFFGIPVENQYNLEVMIEAPGFNCTLAPYYSCANENSTYPDIWHRLAEYDERVTKDSVRRLNKLISGYELTPRDVTNMMHMCAYETVALGYSSFCPLFHKSEWKAYEYRSDLYWWYSGSFGYPQARAMGVGWLQELVSRLTHTRLTEHNSTTNSTFHNDVQFPLNDPIYVDFTHDTQFALLLPTMNLTSFASGGQLPWDGPPKHHSFISSSIMPFATNMQLQVLSCGAGRKEEMGDSGDDSDDEDSVAGGEGSDQTEKEDGREQEERSERKWWGIGETSDEATHQQQDGRFIRIILNDAVVPLTGIRGCTEHEQGLCGLDEFVDSMRELVGEVDFAKECGKRESVEGDAGGEE